VTHLSLFSGVGGLEIAAEWAGFVTVGQCEMADFPTRVLEKHWPDVPRWRDIKTLTAEDFHARTGLRTVDLLTGGFPCQPFSDAGKRRGREDDRYLWPEMLRVITELQPAWVVGENVDGIVRMALDDVLADLEAEGYETGAYVLPACGVGAAHRRYRVAIVANADQSRGGRERHICNLREFQERDLGQRKPDDTSEPSEVYGNVADTKDIENRRIQQPEIPAHSGADCEDVPDTACELLYRCWESRGWRPKPAKCCDVEYAGSPRCEEFHIPPISSTEGHAYRGCDASGRYKRQATQSCMGIAPDGVPGWMARPVNAWDCDWDSIPRLATGVKDRVAKLKALGNAVVPQQFYPVFMAISEILREG